VVKSNIDLAEAKHNLDITAKKEAIDQLLLDVMEETNRKNHEVELLELNRGLTILLRNIDAQLQKHQENAKAVEALEQSNDISHAAKLRREKEEAVQHLSFKESANNLDITMLKEQTDAVVKRFASAQGGFSEALLALSSNEVIAKVAESLSVQNIIGGKNFTEVVTKLFSGSSLEPIMQGITKRISAPRNGDKSNRPTV